MHEGTIFKNASGRYSLHDGYYWTCGDGMELLIDGHWISGRVEHGYNSDYYFISTDGIKISLNEGMIARA